MPQPIIKPSSNARIERELERERQQHLMNHEAKSGLHDSDSDRIKDPRENFERIKVRR